MLHIRRGRKSSFYIPKVIPVLATVIFLVSLIANAWTLSARAVAPGISANQAKNQNVAAQKAAAASAETTPFITISETPEACSTTRPYRAPAIVDLSVAHDGLTAIVSEPYTYSVSANSLAGLRTGITNCPIRAAVAGSYHAITARQIAWSYSFAQSNSQCTLINVRVGLHVTQLLPDFSPKAGTPKAVVDAWNAYHTSLLTHENGHVDVAKRYASDLVTRLNSLGSMDCSTLRLLAKTTVDAELEALNTADTSYDATTRHGATQGAVL